jgi:ferric-dicitrate binding protein FerR (iron transport regulator)
MDPQRDPVDVLAERIARVQPVLDDVARQRVLSRLHQQLAQDRGSSPAWRLPAGLVAALAIVALGLVLFMRPPLPRQLAKVAPTPSQPTAASQLPAAAFQPYLVAGTDAERAAAWLEHGVSALQLGAGERVHAMLGPARLDIIGPAQLRLQQSSAGRFELELSQGTLLGDYDHSRGGRLTIRAPDLSVEIVGTLFMVQADSHGSRVSVARGAVRVRRGNQELGVVGGQALPAGARAPSVLSAAEASALEEHERSFAPASGSQGVLGITGPRLRAELAGKLLADTPLWVRLPVGAHTVTLLGGDAGPQQLRTNLRSGQRVEALIAAPSAPSPPVLPPRPERSRAHAVRDTASSETTSAAELYREAESAMRTADLERAAQLLAQLVRSYPDASLVDLAVYELAELATRRADHGEAHDWLTRLEQRGLRPALRESAAYLRCRNIRARESSAKYVACLEAFLVSFPDSARSAEVRALLAVHPTPE